MNYEAAALAKAQQIETARKRARGKATDFSKVDFSKPIETAFNVLHPERKLKTKNPTHACKPFASPSLHSAGSPKAIIAGTIALVNPHTNTISSAMARKLWGKRGRRAHSSRTRVVYQFLNRRPAGLDGLLGGRL